VVDTTGAAQAGQVVVWETPGGAWGGYVTTGANGQR
jgi:hypothetical protein